MPEMVAFQIPFITEPGICKILSVQNGGVSSHVDVCQLPVVEKEVPMYLIRNNHQGIVSRDAFNAVQAELARRNAGKSPSKKNAPTGKTSYASKYALSERLVCGECGTLYRRCTWTQKGEKRVVWRCVSRLDYGKQYCQNSPSLHEDRLQEAILNSVYEGMNSNEYRRVYNKQKWNCIGSRQCGNILWE